MNQRNVEMEWNSDQRWIVELLRLSEPAESSDSVEDKMFASRCARAAELALSLSKLRRERQRIGFMPMAARDYLKKLAQLADIRPSSISAAFDCEDFSVAKPQNATAFAKLAQQIGISLREALAHLRLDFAAHLNSPHLPLLLARGRSTGGFATPIESCEALLQQLESEYDITNLQELRLIENELTNSYDRAV